MDLTSIQIESLDLGEAVPVVVDGRNCVLLSESTYQDLLDEWHPSTMKRHLAEMMREDWSDPAMSVYDE